MTKTMADSPKKNGRLRPHTEQPVSEELVSVPLLGPTRIKALADAGYRTLTDLSSATEDQLGSVKGIGARNAQKIKAWLVANAGESAVASAVPVVADANSQSSPANQRLQAALAELDQAVFQIKALLPGRALDRKLIAQLDKMNAAATDIPESGVEPADQWEKALRRLKKVTALVLAAAAHNLSDKAKRGLRDDIRKRRRRLQKALEARQ
jgi:NAD-dependent DNA ligase